MIGSRVRRRLLAAIGGAAAIPRAFAQAPRKQKTVGIMTAGGSRYLARTMAKHGWVEGRDVRFAVKQASYAMPPAELDAAASGLVAMGCDVLVAQGAAFVLALHRATRSIPIVCAGIHDPVDAGLAHTLQRPGMNVTGLSFGLREAAALQFGTLRSLVPGLRRVVFLTVESEDIGVVPAHEDAAKQFGLATDVHRISPAGSVEKALDLLQPTDAAWLAQTPAGASIESIAAAAKKRRIAVHAMGSDQVRAGLLLSYWIVFSDLPARVAAIVDKVLRGGAPGTIPFEMPDKTDFAFNRATARAIGAAIPDDILMRATEVFG